MNGELHVIFGTGAAGKAAARELIKLGARVRMVNRSGKASELPNGLEVMVGDAYDAAQTTALTRGAAAVYQCAQPEYHEWAEKFPPLQAAIMQGATANGAKLIVLDNLYGYGRPNGRTLTEDSPIQPQTKKGKVRAAMAQQILDAHAAGTLRAAILRPSNYVGAYDMAGELVVIPALKGETANLFGRLDQPHSFSYMPNVGEALAALGTRDEALGQVWFPANPPPITQGELIGRLEAIIGKPVKVRVATALVMRGLGLFNPTMREVVEMMYEYSEPFITDSSKIERAFGLRPASWDEIVPAMVDYFRAQLEGIAGAKAA